MVQRLVVRALGYVLCCVAPAVCAGGVSVIALTHLDSGTPAWMPWVASVIGICSLWVLLRAPFVGLVVYPSLVVHRTWSVSHAYARDSITGANAVGYVGVLGGRAGGQLPLLSMAQLQMRDGRRIQVPELAGSRRGVARRLTALGVPTPA